MHSSSWSVRPFYEDDEADVVGVWFRSGRATYHFLPQWRTLTLEQAGAIFRDTIRPGSVIRVGVLDEDVAGYLAMRGSYIDRMYVDPPKWRTGCGSSLIEFAKSACPDGLELHTHQENHAACSFYEKHGFEAVKYGISPPPESAPDVEYHWRPVAAGENSRLE